jgi:hypothetical protein
LIISRIQHLKLKIQNCFSAGACQQNVLVRASQCVSACPVKFTIVTSAAHLTGVAK